MSVVPGFKYDLFISYAHANDQPWGWVTQFINTLKAELECKSREFTIWWDPNLRSGTHVDMEIAEAISESAVFLSVLSLAYGESSYCKSEVEEFRLQRHPAFPLIVGNMSRMQGIRIEREFTRERWPPELRRTSPQPFFDEHSPLFSRPTTLAASDPWVQSLWEVRDSIWSILSSMRQQNESGANLGRSYGVRAIGAARGPLIQVAEVTDDLYLKREKLLSTLREGKDCEVLAWSEPTVPPDSGTNTLSVHMFGKYPGRAFGTGDQPLGRLQLHEAIRSHPARRPVVWIAHDLDLNEAETEEHKTFLGSLLNSNDIELLRTDFEDLKGELQERMRMSEAPPAKAIRSTHESPIVHIWHSMDNPASLKPLKQYLIDHDCGISVFNCGSTPTDRMHSCLAVCDGLMVPYTHENRTWAEDVLTEAFRLHRHDDRPALFAAVQLPPAEDSEFNFEHPRVVQVNLHQPGEFTDVSPFLEKLEHENV
jgi:hypothetical protein